MVWQPPERDAMGYYDRDSDERPPLPGAGYMEDYTGAFLISAGVLVFIALFAIWAAFGLPVTLILAVISERLMRRL